MKIKFTVMFLLISFVAQSQVVKSPVIISKIKAKVKAYLKNDGAYPKGVLETHYSDVSLTHNRIDKMLLQKADNPVVNAKIDSLIELEKANPTYPHNTIYSILHVVKQKGKDDKEYMAYSFFLDEHLNIIHVDKGTATDIIALEKVKINNADTIIRLIKEISSMN